jgi:micrococcal nuclease
MIRDKNKMTLRVGSPPCKGGAGGGSSGIMLWTLRQVRITGCISTVLFIAATANAQSPAVKEARAKSNAPPATQTTPQPRPHGARVAVDLAKVSVDDGDTIVIRWADGDAETVRILGIDTPETRHLEHNIPFDQPLGLEARAFARGVFAGATQIELLRAAMLDPYGRTLGYVFVNGRNYSLLAIKAGYTTETVTHYGDNGLPAEAAEVLAAAKAAPPLVFEPPFQYRGRMRALSTWLKQQGQYPAN